MKFLCDVMLARVARWLRAAGYDTELAGASLDDDELLRLALRDERLLITRDKHFLAMKEGKEVVIFLASNSVSACLEELNQKLKLNWLYRPFSRCLLCNTVVVPAETQAVEEQVPADTRQAQVDFWYCSRCKKVYWEGSHTKRMRQRLTEFGQ